MDSQQLTAQEQGFIAEYLLDEDATQAGVRVGLGTTELEGDTGHTLLQRPHVKAAVAQALGQKKARAHLSDETLLNEMSKLALSSIDHYVITDDGKLELAAGAPDGAMRAVQSFKSRKRTVTDKQGNVIETWECEIKLWDKPTPLKLMGRQAGLFPDRVEHTGKDGKPIEIHEVRRVVVDPAALDVASTPLDKG